MIYKLKIGRFDHSTWFCEFLISETCLTRAQSWLFTASHVVFAGLVCPAPMARSPHLLVTPLAFQVRHCGQVRLHASVALKDPTQAAARTRSHGAGAVSGGVQLQGKSGKIVVVDAKKPAQ